MCVCLGGINGHAHSICSSVIIIIASTDDATNDDNFCRLFLPTNNNNNRGICEKKGLKDHFEEGEHFNGLFFYFISFFFFFLFYQCGVESKEGAL